MSRLFSILIISIVFLSCKKDKPWPKREVEFSLLKSYQFVSGKCQVDASTAILETLPLVTNDDILWYSKNNYEFGLTANAIQKINAAAGRSAFAVTVDKEVIFLAVYMPGFMSSTCDHSITMDVNTLSNVATMHLGYPVYRRSANLINDQRNNPFFISGAFQPGEIKINIGIQLNAWLPVSFLRPSTHAHSLAIFKTAKKLGASFIAAGNSSTAINLNGPNHFWEDH